MRQGVQKTVLAPAPGLMVSKGLSKASASLLIRDGMAHIHSAPLKERDACVKVTRKKLGGKPSHYPWHANSAQLQLRVHDSRERCNTINTILGTLFFNDRTNTKATIRLILEELTSNAFYHSLRDRVGEDLFVRNETVSLPRDQAIEIAGHRSDSGAYLSVTDKGGTLCLKDIGDRLVRCYQRIDDTQLEKKDGGAGLGFFMIFENTTHIEISVVHSISTTISVWFPLMGGNNPEYFSFNYWGGLDAAK